MIRVSLRTLALTLAAAALLAAAPARATEFDCLWSSLTSSDKARIELSVQIGEAPPRTLLDRWGERGLTIHFQRCAVPIESEPLERASRYITARATAEILFSAIVAEGVDAEIVMATLDALAPADQRRALAEEIMALELSSTNGPAASVVRSSAEAIQSASPRVGGGDAKLLRLGAEWTAAKILADGIAEGAAPPKR